MKPIVSIYTIGIDLPIYRRLCPAMVILATCKAGQKGRSVALRGRAAAKNTRERERSLCCSLFSLVHSRHCPQCCLVANTAGFYDVAALAAYTSLAAFTFGAVTTLATFTAMAALTPQQTPSPATLPPQSSTVPPWTPFKQYRDM
jgi:hypothetical protein